MPAVSSRNRKASVPGSRGTPPYRGRVRDASGRFVSAKMVSTQSSGTLHGTAGSSDPLTTRQQESSPPPVPVGYMPGTGRPVYSLLDSNRIARENMPPPPSEWPRMDWKGVGFGVPDYSKCTGVGLGEINWGCKNGSVAVVKALGSGDWSFIEEPATAIMLAICDKVMLLNDYYREVHCVMGCLDSFQAWENERSRDIESTFQLALSKVPSSLDLSMLSLEKVAHAAFACLHADYQLPADAFAVLPRDKTITFQRSWFGEFSPKISDLVSYGSFVLRGRINIKKADVMNKLLKAAQEHEDTHGPPSALPADNPLNVLPPLKPPPIHVPIEYAAYDDVQIFIPTAGGQLQQWTPVN